MKKITITIFTVAFLLFGYTPCYSQQSGICGDKGDNLRYEIVDSTLIIWGTGDMKHYYGRGTTKPPWNIYVNGTIRFNKVEIEEGVTSIGNGAFYMSDDTYTIDSFKLPNSLTSIGMRAFGNCQSLDSFYIPPGVKAISDETFYSCKNLAYVNIPLSVLSIGQDAFNSCISLTAIDIPAGVTNISSLAFANCSNLTAINIDDANAKYSSFDGVLFDKSGTMLIKCPVGKTSYVAKHNFCDWQ